MDNFHKVISDEKLQLVTGQIIVGQAVLVSYSLGLFELISKTPLTVGEIGHSLGISCRSTQALISCASAMDFVELKNKKYGLTPLGNEYLNPVSPAFYGPVFDLLIEQQEIMSFPSVKQAILKDSPQVDSGKDLFSDSEGLANTQEFVSSIHQKAFNPAIAWSKTFPLENYNQFIDIGGGSGVHAIAACLHNPHLKAIICDRKAVLPHTESYVKTKNLSHRITTKCVDLWKDNFPKGDVFFLGDIFHDWAPNKCILLAKKCYESINTNGAIILHEMLFNIEKTSPLLTSAYNTKMMLWTEGQQYSFQEIKHFLKEAGFLNISSKKTLGNWSIITARK